MSLVLCRWAGRRNKVVGCRGEKSSRQIDELTRTLSLVVNERMGDKSGCGVLYAGRTNED